MANLLFEEMSNSEKVIRGCGFIIFIQGLPVIKPSNSTEQLRPLTSLRFFAAAAVLVLHLSPPNPNNPAGFGQLNNGVTFFFMLSGFILTYTYFTGLGKFTVRGTWNFYVARVARIWPVHLLALAIVLPFCFSALRASKHCDPILNLASTATLIHTFAVAPSDFVLNAPSWSLSAEFFFYLCFPFLIWGLASRNKVRRALVILCALSPRLLASQWFLDLMHLVNIRLFDGMFTGVPILYFTPIRLSDFVVGMLLGRAWLRSRKTPSSIGPAKVRQATLSEFGAVLFLVGWSCMCARLAPSREESSLVTWSGAYYPPFLLCIWVFASGRGMLSKLFSTRLLNYLGEISFGIYMFHAPVMASITHLPLIREIFDWSWRTMGVPGGVSVIVLVTMILSAASYHLYEMPLRNWMRRKLSIRKASETVVTAGESNNPESIVRRAA